MLFPLWPELCHWRRNGNAGYLRVFFPWLMSAVPGPSGFLNTQVVCNPPRAWQHPNLLTLHEGAKHSQILRGALGNAGQWNGVTKPSLRVSSNAAQHISLSPSTQGCFKPS